MKPDATLAAGTRPFGLSQAARHTEEQPIGELIELALTNPDLISLAAGLVDQETLPNEVTRDIVSDLLSDPVAGKAALQYGPTRGDEKLRHLVYDHMAGLDGISPDLFPGNADQVVLTTGSQQGQHLLAEVLLDCGDIVIVGWPSYFVLTGALTAWQCEVRAVEMDDQGMIPQQLDDLLAALDKINQLHRVKIVYVQTFHQNPTGRTLAEPRRQELLDIVRKYSKHHKLLLLEDAAYRELTYSGPTPKSILSRDPDLEHTALLMTFSKPFSPGLRTGYALLPSDMVEPVLRAKGGRDFGSNYFSQKILARAMETGAYEKHVTALCARYAQKAERMNDGLAKLNRTVDLDLRVVQVHGGLYGWVELPESIRADPESDLFRIAVEEGVLYVPGTYCFPKDPARTVPMNTLRLSFGLAEPEEITEGLDRFARSLQRVCL
ncbi:aminotransferase-like domain-containing protein [Mucisphaera calidilacus]|uniref:2-aminoadipate transaminase n=1 Tax=Mucisphaera calidilacus TaxID=2527982 RepID=A0A518C144_9BACT|nr:PLP-dependent aminotransferase family protein [Mucisphaera calidilacus]QDU72930.1 2-aminoadipate transaminase [Mucisphaera calidilacus]